jgi:hypothetical protein
VFASSGREAWELLQHENIRMVIWKVVNQCFARWYTRS